jgi:quercetin dioxygenase-like cupin family protein
MKIAHHFGGEVYAKEMHLDRGQFVVSHRHKFEHLSILGRGSVEVEIEDRKTDRYYAPACIVIPAGKHHKITALAPVVWYCVHSTTERDPNKVDESLVEATDMPAVVNLVLGEK